RRLAGSAGRTNRCSGWQPSSRAAFVLGLPARTARAFVAPTGTVILLQCNYSLTTWARICRIAAKGSPAAMPITCICPKCRKPLSIAEQYAGQPMKCPFCATMFQSPSLTAVSAQQAPGTSNPFSDGAAAGYDGPTPPWQLGRRDAAAPEWPWLVGPQ